MSMTVRGIRKTEAKLKKQLKHHLSEAEWHRQQARMCRTSLRRIPTLIKKLKELER